MGSKFGLSLGEDSSSSDTAARGVTVFPGVSAGMVLNVNPAIRLGAGMDFNIIRLERFLHEGQEVVATARQRSLVGYVDFFVSITSAIRIEYAKDTAGLAGTNDISIRREGKGLSLGGRMHLI